MKLSELQKSIPPTPWGVGINPATGKIRVDSTGEINLPEPVKTESKEVIYMLHCANTMPKLVEALQGIQNNCDDFVNYFDGPGSVETIDAVRSLARQALADAEEVKGI